MPTETSSPKEFIPFCHHCERWVSICECYPWKEAKRARFQTQNSEGSTAFTTLVQIPYGQHQVRGELVSMGCSGVEFNSDEEADDFVRFLNSDAIFECQIPQRFLNSPSRGGIYDTIAAMVRRDSL